MHYTSMVINGELDRLLFRKQWDYKETKFNGTEKGKATIHLPYDAKCTHYAIKKYLREKGITAPVLKANGTGLSLEISGGDYCEHILPEIVKGRNLTV